jgi:hypothetical protein
VSVITGENKPVTRAERFASALAKWDIQAHRTLVEQDRRGSLHQAGPSRDPLPSGDGQLRLLAIH